MNRTIKKIYIGLENHLMLELEDDQKLFCGCKIESEICGICLGYPGTLPSLNIQAIHSAISLGVMIGANISPYLSFDRKLYRYRDLPKLYQITQKFYPIIQGGMIGKVAIKEAHLEEDAGKTIGNQVDFGRSGDALIEVVTECCIHNVDDVETYLRELREIALYLKLINPNKSNAIRCDVNLSFEYDNGEKTKRIEIKNLNSISDIKDSLNYEIRTQNIYDQAQTRGWNGTSTYFMREKIDYEYMPEYDIVPLNIETMRDDNLLNQTLLFSLSPASYRKQVFDLYHISEEDSSLLSVSISLDFRQIIHNLSSKYTIDSKIFTYIMNLYLLFENELQLTAEQYIDFILPYLTNREINLSEVMEIYKQFNSRFISQLQTYLQKEILSTDNIIDIIFQVSKQNITRREKITLIKQQIEIEHTDKRKNWSELIAFINQNL